MIYVITGGPGAGKSVTTIFDVRQLQLAAHRPVYYYNIKLKGEALTWGWIERDPREWQQFPPDSIILADEAHKYFPKRSGMASEPAHIEAIAEHRHEGKDFYLITQHPGDLDIFIRRRVAAPGWHRHLKRKGTSSAVTVLEFNSCHMTPENKSALATALISSRPYPKEAFDWYESTEVDTVRRRIPRQVLYVIGLAVVVLAAFGYGAWSFAQNFGGSSKGQEAAAAPAGQGKPGPTGEVKPEPRKSLTTAEYVAIRQARIPGLPQTAPAYDGLTAPQDAPYPAACVDRGGRCDCWTQQGTRLTTPVDLCRQIVANGFFLEWHKQAAPQGVGLPGQAAAAAAPAGPSRSEQPAAGNAVKDAGGLNLVYDGRNIGQAVEVQALQQTPTWVGALTRQEAQDAAILQSMRDGQWSKR